MKSIFWESEADCLARLVKLVYDVAKYCKMKRAIKNNLGAPSRKMTQRLYFAIVKKSFVQQHKHFTEESIYCVLTTYLNKSLMAKPQTL